MQFLFNEQTQNNHVIYYLNGDLNYEGSCKLKEAFTKAIGRGERDFVLNLEGLKLIASYSLSTILKLSYLAKKEKGTLAIICPEGNVWDVFYILEIGKVIPMFSNEELFWESKKNNPGTTSVAP